MCVLFVSVVLSSWPTIAWRREHSFVSSTARPVWYLWTKYTSPEKNRYIQSREEEAWWYVVCVHNNNNFFFFFFFLLGRNYTQNSKLQQQQSFKNKYKPKTWQAQRGKKFKTSISLHTEDLHFLLLLLQNVKTNTHSNTYTHINRTEISQQNMS